VTSARDTILLVFLSLGALHNAPLAAQRRRPVSPPQRIVFVCEHGTVKSVVALEYFNQLARAKGLAFEAISRGTHPDSALPSAVYDGLTRDGFDVSRFQPMPFASTDARSAALVVALDADVDPVVRGSRPVIRWDSLPSVTTNYSVGRTAIRRRVERLVDSLFKASRRIVDPQANEL